MKTVVVVQARVGSTRLPGKVLLPVGSRTLLETMLERLACARTPDVIVVATTTSPDDDAIADVARAAGLPCHRGHPTDLLDRHYEVARGTGADVVVKVPSDCPLIDPAVVDRVVTAHREAGGRVDYTSNLYPESWPDGSDVEAVSMDALATAFHEAALPHEREHTTPFVWDQPDRFRLANVTWAAGRDVSRTHRIVVDYGEDLDVVRAVFGALWTPSRPVFSVEEIVAFLDTHPHVRLANARHFGVTWQSRTGAVLRTGTRSPDRRRPPAVEPS